MRSFKCTILSLLLLTTAGLGFAAPPNVVIRVAGSLSASVEYTGGGSHPQSLPFSYNGLNGNQSEVLTLSVAPHPLAGHVISWNYHYNEPRGYPWELEFDYNPFTYGSGSFSEQHGEYNRIEAGSFATVSVWVLAPKHRNVRLFGVARGVQSVTSHGCFNPKASNTLTGHAPWEAIGNGSGWENILIADGTYLSENPATTINGFVYYRAYTIDVSSSLDGLDELNGETGTYTGQAEWSVRIHAKVLN